LCTTAIFQPGMKDWLDTGCLTQRNNKIDFWLMLTKVIDEKKRNILAYNR